jgi:xanthine dehydrogenase small subunit
MRGDHRTAEALRVTASASIGEGKNRFVVPATVDDARQTRLCSKQSRQATLVAGSTDVGLWVTKHSCARSRP